MNAPRGAATAATAAKKAAKTAKLVAAASTLGLGLVALVGAAATLLPRHLLDAQLDAAPRRPARLLDGRVLPAPRRRRAGRAKAARRDAADVLFHLVESTRREGALWLGLGLGSPTRSRCRSTSATPRCSCSRRAGPRPRGIVPRGAPARTPVGPRRSLAALVDASHAWPSASARRTCSRTGAVGARVLCARLVALPCLWVGCVSQAKARAKDEPRGPDRTVLRRPAAG